MRKTRLTSECGRVGTWLLPLSAIICGQLNAKHGKSPGYDIPVYGWRRSVLVRLGAS